MPAPRHVSGPAAWLIVAGLACLPGWPAAAESPAVDAPRATARVVIRLPDVPSSLGPAEPLEAESLRALLLADEAWIHATAGANAGEEPGDHVPASHGSLQVEVARADGASLAEITVSVCHPDARVATGTVRALADHLARRLASIRRRGRIQAIVAAAAATDQAWARMKAAGDRLRQFVDHQWDQVAEKPGAATVETEPRVTEPTANKGSPAEILNPDWVRLDQELRELHRRRAALLVDRTPAHPAVRGLDDQIEKLEQAEASCPRMIAGAGSLSTDPSPPPRPARRPGTSSPLAAGGPSGSGDTGSRQAMATYQTLTAAAVQAEQAWLARWRQERVVRAVELGLPELRPVELKLAEARPVEASSDGSDSEAPSTTGYLIWGLAGLLGVATLGFGSLGFFSRLAVGDSEEDDELP